MQAIHGGPAKHDPIDAQKMAGLLRGGLLPQASGSPAQMRTTRDLLRRRRPLMRRRAELLTHVQQTTSPFTWPESGHKIADNATRLGVAERWADPAVPTSLEGDLAPIGHEDRVLNDLE